MSDKAIRKLFCVFVEAGTLDEKVAERILQRILKVLFDKKTDSVDG